MFLAEYGGLRKQQLKSKIVTRKVFLTNSLLFGSQNIETTKLVRPNILCNKNNKIK